MKEKKNYSELLTYLSILLFLNHFGISILEAMSYQLPIIATPVGGITDLVENNVNGILIEPGNKKQLYEAILFFNRSSRISFRNGTSIWKESRKNSILQQ